MTSPQAAKNTRNGALVYAEVLRDLALRDAGPKRPYFSNFAITQNALEVRHETRLYGVDDIAGSGNPLKVSDEVVCFDEINVVHLGKVLRVRKEGHRNQPMNGDVAVDRGGPKVDSQIAPVPEYGPQNAPLKWALASGLPSAGSVSAADVSEVADLVDGVEFGDRYGSPFLSDFGIHAAGLPSGESGLEIKNPSRAATLGGFAIDSTNALRSQEIGG